MFQCPPPKSTAASPKQLPANGRRRRLYSARSYATGGAWGGGQAHIAARRAQDIPDVYAGEASRLLDGQLEDLHSRLKEPGIVAAITRQGLRLSELIGLAKEVSGPEGRDGRQFAGHLLGQVLWDAGVATDGAPPEAGGAGPKRPNSAGLATRRQCSAGFSDDTGWSDPRSTRQHMRKPTEIIGHGSPETWREQKWRTMSAREYRVDRCAYEAQNGAGRDVVTRLRSRRGQIFQKSAAGRHNEEGQHDQLAQGCTRADFPRSGALLPTGLRIECYGKRATSKSGTGQST